jgi:hypothetical protein
MNGGNQIHSGHRNYGAGNNVQEGDWNGEPLKMEEPKKTSWATAGLLPRDMRLIPRQSVWDSQIPGSHSRDSGNVTLVSWLGKLLMALASTVNLGFRSRRESWSYFYSFQDIYVFWNGASSLTSGGVWLLLLTPPSTGDESWWNVTQCNWKKFTNILEQLVLPF